MQTEQHVPVIAVLTYKALDKFYQMHPGDSPGDSLKASKLCDQQTIACLLRKDKHRSSLKDDDVYLVDAERKVCWITKRGSYHNSLVVITAKRIKDDIDTKLINIADSRYNIPVAEDYHSIVEVPEERMAEMEIGV